MTRNFLLAAMLLVSHPILAQNSEGNAKQIIDDLASRIELHGYAQAGYTYKDAGEGSPTNTFDVKRVLFWAKAKVTDRWSFLFMHDFSSVVQEFYTDYKVHDAFCVRFGQFKNSYSLENPLSPTKLELIECYSQAGIYLTGCGSDPLYGVQYSRDLGLMVYGNVLNKHLFYEFAVMNGQGINRKDGNKQKLLSDVTYPLMNFSVRAMINENDLLWMGGDKGVNVVSLIHKDPVKDVKPTLSIRSIYLHGGDSILWGGYGKMPAKLPSLSSKDRHITFTFSTNIHSLLLKTQYRTRLDKGSWSTWDNDTHEEYPNLSVGSHVFEVQARDAFGRVTEPVSIAFSITPPIYMRWYMILLYLVMLGFFIYALMRWRLYRLERDKQRLETLVQERTQQVVRLEKMATVGKLTQGLIDRILNPLNYINNFAKLSQGLVKDATANIEDEKEHMDQDNYEDTMDVLDMLKGNLEKVGEHGANTTRTLKAMEEMLKDRSGGRVSMNLTSLLQQDKEMLEKYYAQEIATHHIKVDFDVPSQELTINANPEMLSKTFMSMLGNAVYAIVKKATRAAYEPVISLKVEQHPNAITITIRDNGIGIESTIIDKVFDPFFTTKPTGEASGVGLYLSREIIQNHDGDITVESTKDEYTEFIITLPIA